MREPLFKITASAFDALSVDLDKLDTTTPSVLVSIENMRRNEWIRYQWINVQTMSMGKPLYLRGGLRPIEDAKNAAEQFDMWQGGRKEHSR